jgi:DNA-binding response OmpR family regulator
MREGFTVDVAGDGLEGLELALQTVYSVMIMDIMLPEPLCRAPVISPERRCNAAG